MKKAPNIFTVHDLMRSVREVSVQINGNYMPARPIGWDSWPNRVRLALMVFTGRADALIWPGGQ